MVTRREILQITDFISIIWVIYGNKRLLHLQRQSISLLVKSTNIVRSPFQEQFFPTIEIQWKYPLQQFNLMAPRPQEIFAHAMTALLWHNVQNFVLMTLSASTWKQNEILCPKYLRCSSNGFDVRGKNRCGGGRDGGRGRKELNWKHSHPRLDDLITVDLITSAKPSDLQSTGNEVMVFFYKSLTFHNAIGCHCVCLTHPLYMS